MTCFRRRKWCSTCGGVRAHARRVETRFEARAGNVLLEYLAVARRDARPARRLPDVEPYDYLRPSRWCHGGILQSSGRSEALPATPTLPGRGACAQQFPISRSERRAPPVATPPALFGAGADGHPKALDRRPLGICPYCGQCAEYSPPKFIGGLSRNAMGVDAPLGESDLSTVRVASVRSTWTLLCGKR